MLIKEIIQKKRDNLELSKEEIEFFVNGVVKESVTNEQISALAMAIFFNNLNMHEKKHLTLSMRNSGEIIEFKDIEHLPIVDKHSTGGVADLVSLPLAPIIAACGGYVPMIAGKGLGHTGGTVDKLNAINGYNTTPSIDTFKEIVKNVGCAIIGQTSNLAPADKRIYTIRDTTATVESIPLICSSILSKKLASGIKNLVMDIKTGNGAFMQTIEKSEELAQNIVDIANFVGVPCTALITDMNEALGRNIGNSLEIVETVNFLTNKNIDEKLKAITFSLATEMLLITKIANNETEALNKINSVLNNGLAAEKFEKMVANLGGNKNILSNLSQSIPQAKYCTDIYLNYSGTINYINCYELGMILVHIGGGRKTATDKLDLSVGLSNVKKIGEKIDNNTPFATLHYNNKDDLQLVTNILNNNITVGNSITNIKYVYKKITSKIN